MSKNMMELKNLGLTSNKQAAVTQSRLICSANGVSKAYG